MKRTATFSIFIVFLSLMLAGEQTWGQSLLADRIVPVNWWVGMKDPRLQLIIHGQNISGASVDINYPGVKVERVSKTENPNYLFVDLTLSPDCRAGTLSLQLYQDIEIRKGKRKATVQRIAKTYPYVLKARTDFVKAQGVDASDLIYLLMPDRFSNGDPTNDRYPNLADIQSDRANPFLRHGGDLQGIINHLDYFKELGVTALWLTPVLENDQPLTNEGGTLRSAYHGYGFTDHYQVDRRFGGCLLYTSPSPRD